MSSPTAFTLPFLRAVFPLEARGLVRFVTGTPGHFPQGIYFLTVEQLHQCQVLPFSTEDQEVYFTPHTFKRQDPKVTKEDAEEAWCTWMECDDEDFSPLSILPNMPSAVVSTSKGRTHAYWFFKSTVDGPVVEAINRCFAYKYLTKDRTGWALTKLLRVPGFLNHKYDPPQQVELLSFEAGRRFSQYDFEQAAPQQIELIGGDCPEYSPERVAAVKEQWAPQIPQAMIPLLTQQQRDRSRALWHLANHCCRIGMKPEEAFVLLHDSPNNKFLDNRFNADQGLWRDICNAYRNSTSVDRQGALGRIKQLKQQRGLPNDVRFEETAKLVYRTMALEGHFYYSKRTSEALFYTHQPLRLVTLAPNNLDCQTYLGTNYMLNGTTAEYRFVAEYLRAQCEAEAPKVTLRDLSYYDQECLYVTDFKGGIYRLDGIKIEHVINGVDEGIFFRHTQESEGYSPDFTGTIEHLDHIFNSVQVSNEQPEEKTRFLIKCWFYSLFFSDCFSTRPMLIFEGEKGSGKSFAFKAMDFILRGKYGSVHRLPPGSKEFAVAVRERAYIFFDGVDEPWKGLAELLSTTATGTTDRVRILYTDNRIAEYEMRCFIGITTMNAHFLRHDLADRAIVLKTRRREVFESEDSLKNGILKNRNKVWGALLKELNRLVKVRKTFKERPGQMRMADFAAFLQACSEAYGRDVMENVAFVTHEQASQVLGRSPLWDVLRIWLANPGNIERTISASDLHNELLVLGRRTHIPYGTNIASPRSLAARLATLQSALKFIKEPMADRWGYRFTKAVLAHLQGPPG